MGLRPLNGQCRPICLIQIYFGDIIMARKSSPSNANANRDNFQAADAFLRLELVDAKGNRHRLPKDVALYVKNFIAEQMINKATADADHEFELVGKVHVVDNSPKEDIEF